MQQLPAVKQPAASFEEIDMFFEGRGEVHQTMKRLVNRLRKADIPYAIMGGMAVNAHGHERLTKDVGVLLAAKGFAEFIRLHVPKDYEPVPGRPRRFVERKGERTVDVLVTGRFPGSGKPGRIAFPHPEKVAETIDKIQYVDLATLTELKLAARRHQDFADVVSLIRIHTSMNPTFPSCIHPFARTSSSAWKRNGARMSTKPGNSGGFRSQA